MKIEASLCSVASTLTFTVVSWREFQIGRFFLNAYSGHSKRCGGPYLARVPLFAHPWSQTFAFTLVSK